MIMKDRPIKPADSALYWIEYVIRHQGAPHLRYPGMDLNWFQRNLIDICAFVILCVIAVVFSVITVFKFLCRKNSNKRKVE